MRRTRSERDLSCDDHINHVLLLGLVQPRHEGAPVGSRQSCRPANLQPQTLFTAAAGRSHAEHAEATCSEADVTPASSAARWACDRSKRCRAQKRSYMSVTNFCIMPCHALPILVSSLHLKSSCIVKSTANCQQAAQLASILVAGQQWSMGTRFCGQC